MTTTSEITTTLKQTVKSTASVEVVILPSKVNQYTQKALTTLAKDVTIKGFRKGMAPLNLIRSEIDPQKLTNKILDDLLPEVLKAIFKDNSLNLIGNPIITKLNTPTDENWTIDVDLPLRPEFSVKNYESIVKKATKSVKKEKHDEQKLKELKLQALLQALTDEIKFDVPQSLIDQEVNSSLTRLLDQLQKLNLKVEDYVKSLGKTANQLKNEYEKAATDNLKTELILHKLSQELGIKVEDKEIEMMLAATGHKDHDGHNEKEEKNYIRHLLTQRKTLDVLLNL